MGESHKIEYLHLNRKEGQKGTHALNRKKKQIAPPSPQVSLTRQSLVVGRLFKIIIAGEYT